MSPNLERHRNRSYNMKIYLPKIGDSKKTVTVENTKKLVIIGKNGSGKSRLALKIEQLNEKCHRISAQKSLVIPSSVPLKSKDAAEDEFLFGTSENKKNGFEWRKRNYRWRGNAHALNDYTQVLSLLFMKEDERNAQYVDDMKLSERKLEIPLSEVDKIKDIWKQVFPQRDISLFAASVNVKYETTEYSGQEMSDGEKVGLYLMAECFCVPPNYIIIIDEPELHLHKSILNSLWAAVERQRQDCIFVYVTHDLNFAAMRKNAKYLIVERFDGENWFYNLQELVSEIPQTVIEDILGAKDKILFVEGTNTSYDFQLYGAIFPNIHIVPCGGCQEVINCVKAHKQYTTFTHSRVFGLIDRDYRSDHEIAQLEKDNIFTASLAEIENFFIVPELLEMILDRMYPADQNGKSDVNQKMYDIKKRMYEIYNGKIESQIIEAEKSEIKFQLSLLINNQFESIKQVIPDFLSKRAPEIHEDIECKFKKAQNNYIEILRLFNYKSVSHAFSNIIGITTNPVEFIIGLLNDTDLRNQAANIWRKYISIGLITQLEIPWINISKKNDESLTK